MQGTKRLLLLWVNDRRIYLMQSPKGDTVLPGRQALEVTRVKSVLLGRRDISLAGDLIVGRAFGSRHCVDLSRSWSPCVG
jgi:hypothetical protein